MNVELKIGSGPARKASEMLLGHNIETCIDTVPGLLSDRLDNPKLLGPAHPVSGLPAGWEGASCQAFTRHRLIAGAGLMGSDALLLVGPWASITQNRRQVRKGEKLVVEVWARVTHKPAKLAVGLYPMPARQCAYGSAEITVQTGQYRPYRATIAVPTDDDEACLSINVSGDGDVWIDQVHMRPEGQDLLCRKMIDAIASLKMPTLRFPGGIVSANYFWQHGTGPVHLRPVTHDAAFGRGGWYVYYDFGTDEYLQMCYDQCITPAITLNHAAGTLEEAVGWAKYVADFYRRRGSEPPMVYWHIGNHPYVPTVDWITEPMYARIVREYVTAIRKVYPNSRFVAVTNASGDPEKETDWCKLVLDEVGPLIDVFQTQTYGGLSIHPASQKDYKAGVSDPAEQMTQVIDSVAMLSNNLRNLIASCRNRGLKTNVGVAEWDFWCTASHRDGRNFDEPFYPVHGMFAAGMLNEFSRLAPDLEVAHFYNLVNVMGVFIHRGADVTETCVADVFRMYRPAFPGDVLPLEVVSPPMGKGSAVDALCMKNDGGTWLFLANRSPSEAARIDLAAFAAAAGARRAAPEVAMLKADSPIGTLKEAKAAAKDGKLELPPLSLARVLFS